MSEQIKGLPLEFLKKADVLKDFFLRILHEKKTNVHPLELLGGVLLIALTGWVFTKGLEGYMDILFWDEANYLNSGKLMFAKFNKGWGPAYALWYKLLSLFEQDSLKLYFLNYRLMTLLPACALFLLLALSNVRRWVAFGVAFLFLFADINLPVWPKVSHFVVMVFLLALSIMRFLPTTALKLAFLLPVALFISYARPEFYLTFVGVFALLVLSFFLDKPSQKNRYLIPASLLMLFAFGVQAFMGNPLFTFKGDRSGLAFAQHFMFNYFQWNNIDQDFWITWMPYFEKEFGGATSLKAAWQANPDLFRRHLASNIQGYIVSSYRYFTDVMLPEKLIALPLRARVAVLVLGGAIAATWLGRGLFARTLMENLRRNMLIIVLLLFFTVPSVLACVAIYPREHYLFLQVPIVILAACLLFFSQPEERPAKGWHNILLSLAVLAIGWILMPSLKKYRFFDLWREETSQANLKTVEKLRAYNFRPPVRLLENEGGMHLFLSDNYTWIRGFMKQEPWTDYIRNQRVDIIYVTPSLTKYPTLAADSTWPAFRDQPEAYGYERISTGNHVPYLLIRKSLLETVSE